MFYEVIHDSGETANKCTITPVAYRPDFRITPVRDRNRFPPLASTVFLHHDGECLSTLRHSLTEVKGIASIDCVWPRLEGLLYRIDAPLPKLARIPDGIVTAYPRGSTLDYDPDGGLATIEAIFVAAALLGNWDATLLSEYYFGRKFIERNRARFLELGLMQADDESTWPTFNARPKTSLQRRLDRGKAPL